MPACKALRAHVLPCLGVNAHESHGHLFPCVAQWVHCLSVNINVLRQNQLKAPAGAGAVAADQSAPDDDAANTRASSTPSSRLSDGMPSLQSTAAVYIEGYLYKTGNGERSWSRAWKRRWVTLESDPSIGFRAMPYFADRSSDKPRGAILLTEVTLALPSGADAIQPLPGAAVVGVQQPRQCTFYLKAPGRVYTFAVWAAAAAVAAAARRPCRLASMGPYPRLCHHAHMSRLSVRCVPAFGSLLARVWTAGKVECGAPALAGPTLPSRAHGAWRARSHSACRTELVAREKYCQGDFGCQRGWRGRWCHHKHRCERQG